jgi:hypothetical protein
MKKIFIIIMLLVVASSVSAGSRLHFSGWWLFEIEGKEHHLNFDGMNSGGLVEDYYESDTYEYVYNRTSQVLYIFQMDSKDYRFKVDFFGIGQSEFTGVDLNSGIEISGYKKF